MLRWDEFVPQCYRMNYKAFEATWLEQIKWVNKIGSGRIKDMYAGIRVVGDGPNATFEEVKKSIELVRSSGGGGHVLWFSRGVLDVYPIELKGLYDVAVLAVTQDRASEALVTRLSMQGVAYDNAMRLAQRFLGEVRFVK